MNKKLLAVAVAAALAPMAAIAEPGNVQITGNLNLSIDYLSGKNNAGNDNTDQWNVSSNSSYIRFQGDENLGNGLKAVWQLTTYVGMGETGPYTNTWTNGNSFVGLNGGFGTALLGKHDTPFKIVGRKVDLFSDQLGDSRNIISIGNLNNTNEWDLRPDNVMAYITPTFSGVHGAIAYVTNVGAGATKENGCGGAACVDAVSALVMYEGGPLMVAGAYEAHNYSNASSLLQDSSAYRLVAGYSFGDFKVTGLYQNARSINTITPGSSGNRNSWGLGGAYKMGANTFKAQFYQADSLDNTDGRNNGADMFALGWDYAMSKRTTAYMVYAKTDNDTNAYFSEAGGGHGDNPGTAVGQNPQGFSVGLKHTF